ncbi:MAG: SIS domain-containing protein [Spirochaetota bacterium]
MNEFKKLLSLPGPEKKKLGVEYTPAEINQQPEVWLKAYHILKEKRDEIEEFMKEAGLTGEKRATILLSGAGTSEYVGKAAQSVLRKALKREVISVPSTDFVSHPRAFIIPGSSYVLVSFARSGNSPESIASYNLFDKLSSGSKQIIITSNRQGELARVAEGDNHTLTIILPEETNDRSLAMTSSFSTMAFTACGLCFLNRMEELKSLAARLGAGARKVMDEYADALKVFITKPVKRVVYLGAGTLLGTMEECRLKMLEMTGGIIAANVNSFLGLRHGPQVFVDKDCLVAASLSTDFYAQQYELDLLKELKNKGQGAGILAICSQATDRIKHVADLVVELFPDGEAIADDYRIMTDVVAGQILALFKSLDIGLKPDNPSVSGTINRVVQGVVIYPFQ